MWYRERSNMPIHFSFGRMVNEYKYEWYATWHINAYHWTWTLWGARACTCGGYITASFFFLRRYTVRSFAFTANPEFRQWSPLQLDEICISTLRRGKRKRIFEFSIRSPHEDDGHDANEQNCICSQSWFSGGTLQTLVFSPIFKLLHVAWNHGVVIQSINPICMRSQDLHNRNNACRV